MSGNSTVVAATRAEAAPRRAAWLALSACVASIGLLAMQVLAAQRLELTFDEAYYTLWSRSLSFGYLDHPPMVALLIRVSTALFGDSELGVRALSLLLVGAMPALIAFIAWRLFGSAEKAALAALMWIAMPLVAIGALFVTPDAPLVVFWTLGLAALVALWRTGQRRWLLAMGLALGLALQSKFTAAFFAAGVVLALIATPSLRRWLVSPALFAGLAVALAIFAPFVVWNAGHGWATFAKQLGRAPPHGFAPYYLAEFLVAQIGLINPLVFAALIPAVAAIPWRAPVAARSRRRGPAHSRLHDRARGGLFPPAFAARPRPGQLACAALSGCGDSGRGLGRRGAAQSRNRPRRGDCESGAMGRAGWAPRRGADLRRDHDRRRPAWASQSARAPRGLS